MSRLVVISNRVALPKQTQTGGLASAMNAALQERGGLWFGWSGNIGKESGAELHEVTERNISYATIDLSRKDHDEYYAGFANRALWPLFHYRGDLVDYRRDHMEGYFRVNAVFADNVARLLQPTDTIWVQDYHLIPLAQKLRERGVRNRIGFFLHTPLPAAGLMITLPRHRELFESLASYDLVGLHTHRDLRSLEDYFLHELGAAMRTGGRIRAANGRLFRAGVFPISIDTAEVVELAHRTEDTGDVARLRHSLDGRELIIGVDRLDYSKGLPQRFDAFARLLRDNEDMRRRVSFLQIAPPSRSQVPEYRQIRRDLERGAGHINGQYAEPDWVPIRYVNKSYPQKMLAGYFRVARVGLVTPLRDGMNLVAKEYIACQDPKDPGVLVLSRFAGAAQELGAALLVNPNDLDDVAEALKRALDMSLKERRQRWDASMEVLEHNDITRWRNAFLEALMHPARNASDLVSTAPAETIS
ncbi:alpha,alpha-trehalose-phosphate synthase (UDP-forming) [Pinirhizobacter sp.]|jgi:trehalose 6-phosphate synthase|uniref:alpha,alpha-trehalose-phosphate synthase (UDP-forming) n=1 Tax=Pinirhizobacter sp. TaxID=2950432 RepID=UPI002F4226F7